jgi:hypothetical protein
LDLHNYILDTIASVIEPLAQVDGSRTDLAIKLRKLEVYVLLSAIRALRFLQPPFNLSVMKEIITTIKSHQDKPAVARLRELLGHPDSIPNIKGKLDEAIAQFNVCVNGPC